MPSVDMSFVYTGGGGLQSGSFTTTSGAQCVDTGTPAPSQLTVVSHTGPGGYNISLNTRDVGCNIIEFQPQRTIPFNNPLVFARTSGEPIPAFGFGVHNVNFSTSITVSWAGGVPPSGPCQFGTQSKAGVPVQELLTQPLVLAIMSAVGASPLAPALVSFFGTIYLIEDLCSRLPPLPPTIDLDIWTRPAQTLKQLLDAAAWPFFCECSPGTPTPVPPGLPVIVVPPGLATIPVATCNPADLCASLVDILTRLGQLEFVLNTLYANVTEMQRFGLPFAYVKGRTFEAQTGTNAVQVERVVGMLVQVTEQPAGLQTFSGAPEYISDLGWISALTPDGLLDEVRLTRVAQTWMSRLLPSANQLSWALREGVTANITELLAEP